MTAPRWRFGLLLGCVACSRPQAPDPAVVAPSASVAVVAATIPVVAPTELPWQTRCLAEHYPAGTAEAGGLRIGPLLVPFEGAASDAPRSDDERLDHPDVRGVFEPPYPHGAPLAPVVGDPGRVRLEPLLEATYAPAAKQLVSVQLVGTTVSIHAKVAPALQRVATRLAALSGIGEYLTHLGGTYNDRTIAGTERKSAHAYGIALDLGTDHADYWRNSASPTWKNRLPRSIVDAFEAERFIWGGRWAHYDTMHFEYRPELFGCGSRSAAYGWDGAPGALAAVDDLGRRFAPPVGFHLAAAAPGTFAAYLGGLPLAAPGTPVRSYRGDELVAGDDPRLAAVTTLDVGTRDLQQCADAVLRLHAEYKFQAGDDAALDYRAVSKFDLPFSRWIAGERVVPRGNDLAWVPGRGKSGRSHASLRSWLDTVFDYANTVSLQRDAKPVPRADIRAGDFFVQGGFPGHAVLVLAVAENGAGEMRALLGQSYMPAQNFQVLAHDGEPWFSLQGDAIETPFWRAFGWSDLRCLP